MTKHIDGSEENKWLFLFLFLILLLTVVLCFDNLSFDVIGFKESNTIFYELVWFSLTFIPLLFLPLFSDWKTFMVYEKILIVGLASFFLVMGHYYNDVFLFSLLFVGAIAVYFYHNRIIYRPNPFYILLIVYVLVNAISLLWTSNLAPGIRHLRHLSPLLFIPVLFCFFKLDKRQFDLIALFIFRATLFYAICSICTWAVESRFLQYPLEDSFIYGKYNLNGIASYEVVYAWTKHMHPTYNGVNLIFALGIGWYYVRKNDVRDNVSYFELLFFILVTLLLSILTASRFMLVVWLFVNFFGVILLIYKNKKLMVIMLLLSIVSVFWVLFFHANAIRDFINDPARMALFNAGLDGIRENTWHGVGLGSMTDYINKDNPNFAYSDLGSDDHFPHIHPHNQLIGDLMQTGVFGLLSMLCIIAFLFFKSFVQRDWLLGTSWFVYVLLMCIEMPLMYPSGVFFLGLVFCFLVQKNVKTIPLFNFNR